MSRPKHETSIKIFISGSCPGVRDCDHGDGGQAVQQPVHHRGGPEEAAGGGQGGQNRGGDPQDCHGGLQELGLKCRMRFEKIKCEDCKLLDIALTYKVQTKG